jgi:hypothetical protein
LIGGRRRRSLDAETKEASSSIAEGVPKSTSGLVSTCREGAESTPRARITVMPEFVRSCWSDTVLGKSLRKTETERERGSSTGKFGFG